MSYWWLPPAALANDMDRSAIFLPPTAQDDEEKKEMDWKLVDASMRMSCAAGAMHAVRCEAMRSLERRQLTPLGKIRVVLIQSKEIPTSKKDKSGHGDPDNPFLPGSFS